MNRNELETAIKNSALAFRGYNVTNLGLTRELLVHKAYGPVLRPYLIEASQVVGDSTGKPADLIQRVIDARETELEDYAEAIALIVAVEQAQLQLLLEFHGIDFHAARVSFGFSLGEISSLVAGGVFTMSDALRIPLALAVDGIELARSVTLAILFSRAKELSIESVRRLLLRINYEGKGVIGISTQLSPNSVLVMGTGQTISLLRERMHELGSKGIHLRINDHRWPPMHTPIVWSKNFSNRAAQMLHTLPGGFSTPHPPVLSLVTGSISYDDYNARDHMIRWVDQTQLLWDAVYEVLVMGIETVVHIGPQPNIVPATFERLATNVTAQLKESRRMWALSSAVSRPWLKNVLPRRAALLRAPQVEQVVLERWLLENPPQ